MILIGQDDSPFVRRVRIALTLYGIGFTHRPWSSFGDAALIRPHNPLTRVPTLVLEDGTALVESHAMLDNLVLSARAMFPRTEPARPRALRLATGARGPADKAVSLFHEQRLHDAAAATTAKHLPASPARAASIVAFMARLADAAGQVGDVVRRV